MLHDAAGVFDMLSTASAPDDAKRHFRTVHVLGGGIAGLIAARLLAEHAERVVIVDPDGAPDSLGCKPRPGVPQGYQVHFLLPGGRTQLARFFPGIVDQALAQGAVLSTPDRSAAYLDSVEQLTTPNAEFLSSSRPFLESLIRSRTLALPGVDIVEGRGTGLDYSDGAVKAVRYTAGTEVTEATDFVVDATGRSSRLSEWLAQGGWPRPEMERVSVDVQYFTARFSRSPDWAGPYSCIVRETPQSRSAELRGAAFGAIENNRWAILLSYYQSGGKRIITDDISPGLAGLPPVFKDIAAGEPDGKIVPHHHPDNRWRHFEALPRFPARLAAVGDSVASTNPVHGQGMTAAALHASCLSEYLRSEPDFNAPARYFLDLQEVIVAAAWQISTTADAARLGTTPAPATATERRHAWAMRQVMAAATQDVQVATAFRAVSFMTAHPQTLAAPSLVRQAARVNQVPEEEFRHQYGPLSVCGSIIELRGLSWGYAAW
jgi:2-polyprenyl-6-methoxyphenol hydroxylase-like FAD-dependent oxidoreductase